MYIPCVRVRCLQEKEKIKQSSSLLVTAVASTKRLLNCCPRLPGGLQDLAKCSADYVEDWVQRSLPRWYIRELYFSTIMTDAFPDTRQCLHHAQCWYSTKISTSAVKDSCVFIRHSFANDTFVCGGTRFACETLPEMKASIKREYGHSPLWQLKTGFPFGWLKCLVNKTRVRVTRWHCYIVSLNLFS